MSTNGPLSEDTAEHFQIMGLAALQRGAHGEAAGWFERAVARGPDDGVYHNNLGQAYQMLGRLDDAARCYAAALERLPDSADVRYNLALVSMLQGRPADAVLCCREALRFRPEYPDAINLLGVALERLDRRDQAVVCYREALRLDSGSASAHSNLGNALRELRRHQEAEDHLRRALEIQPRFAAARYNLAALYQDRGRLAEAEQQYRHAVDAEERYPEAWSNLAAVLLDQGQPADAARCARRALELRPGMLEALCNLGYALKLEHALPDSLECFRQALIIAPEDAKIHWNYALALLLAGEWDEGWREYEWRVAAGITPPPLYKQPAWDGAPLEGRRILLWAEQGFGDTIQFLRYARVLARRGGRVVCAVPPRLLPLLENHPDIEAAVDRGNPPPPFDCHAPMLSLIRLCGTAPEAPPAEVPYLEVPAAKLAHWREALAGYPGLKVGLNWTGNPDFKENHLRSLPFRLVAPLVAIPGVTVFCLRPEGPPEPLAGLVPLERETHEITDTAAIMESLDLVVTVDTMTAHLAGALARPVWTLLGYTPDWRWGLAGDATPWYPTMRLFRQPRFGDWRAVVERVRTELAARAASHPSTSSVDVGAPGYIPRST